jgi:hypothetical protein
MLHVTEPLILLSLLNTFLRHLFVLLPLPPALQSSAIVKRSNKKERERIEGSPSVQGGGRVGQELG